MNLAELTEKVRSAHGARLLPGDLAGMVLDEALRRPDAWDLLIQAVSPYVYAIERKRVRDTEHEVFGNGSQGTHGTHGATAAAAGDDDGEGPTMERNPNVIRPNPAEEAMRRLLADTVYVPGHGLVPWGQLTVELHQLRTAYVLEQLRKFAQGTRATVRRHEAAIGLLTGSGLRDLDSYAARYGVLPDEVTRRRAEEDEVPA